MSLRNPGPPDLFRENTILESLPNLPLIILRSGPSPPKDQRTLSEPSAPEEPSVPQLPWQPPQAAPSAAGTTHTALSHTGQVEGIRESPSQLSICHDVGTGPALETTALLSRKSPPYGPAPISCCSLTLGDAGI